MKPTDWNNRSHLADLHAADDVDCMPTNLQRAHVLAPFYKY